MNNLAIDNFEREIMALLMSQIKDGSFELSDPWWTHKEKGGAYSAVFNKYIMVKSWRKWKAGYVEYHKYQLRDGCSVWEELPEIYLRPALQFLDKFRPLSGEEVLPLLKQELAKSVNQGNA